MSRFDSILGRVEAAGWFPTRLSAEAGQALAIPALPQSPHLQDIDYLGITYVCLFLTYCRRFLSDVPRSVALSKGDEINALGMLAVVSLLRQLGAEKRIAGRVECITGDDYGRWQGEFQQWWQTRLKPAYARLQQVDNSAGAEDLEPALTLARVDRGFVLFDFDGIAADFGIGLEMHLKGTLRVKSARAVADHEIGQLAALVRGHGVAILDGRGNLRCHSPSIKTALDAALGRVDVERREHMTGNVDELATSSAQAEELAVQREVAQALDSDMSALPREVREFVRKALEIQQAQEVLDVIHQASCHDDPAMKAAMLYTACPEAMSRERLAQVFGTTPDKIRTAGKKVK